MSIYVDTALEISNCPHTKWDLEINSHCGKISRKCGTSLLIFLCSEYATDVNVLVARKAIQAIGKIALRVPARANTCADKLVSLLAMEIDYVTAETLISLASELSIHVDSITHVHIT